MKNNNREVVEVLKAESGRAICIYAVKNHKITKGAMYQVEYKLGNFTEEFESRLIDSTDGDRTLIFNHPESVNKTIGVPNWNIINLVKL